MENLKRNNEYIIIQAVEHAIDNSEFLKLLSKKVLDLYKTSILINYNQKRIYNKISGSDEEYDIALGVFSKKAIELNKFIELFCQQLEEMDLSEIKNMVCKYIEVMCNQKIEVSNEEIKKALLEIVNKFKINEYYNELIQLYYGSLSEEKKSDLSDTQIDSATEMAVARGYLGSGYPYEQKENYQKACVNAENGNLFTTKTFLDEISKATISVKNTLKNSEVHSQMDSHHRVI